MTQAYLVEGGNRVRVYQPDGMPAAGFCAGRADAGRRVPVSDQDRRAAGSVTMQRRSRRKPGQRSGARPTPVPSEVGIDEADEAGDSTILDRVPGRPLYQRDGRFSAVWAFVLVLLAWGFSNGTVRHSARATRPWAGRSRTSPREFAVAMQLAIFTMFFYGFFVAVAAGMTVIQDEEWRLGELLHATPLRRGEYIWAKFAAVLAGCLIILAIHLAAMLFFYHVLPNAEAQEFRGPFSAFELLEAGAGLLDADDRLLGGDRLRGRRVDAAAGAVYLLPVAIVLFDGFFLWEWSPSWLDPRIDRALMLIDPAGFRWLNETWLKVDRGVSFYNTAAIPFDRGFLAQPGGVRRLGFGSVALEPLALRGDRCAGTSRATRRSERGGAAAAPDPIIEATRPVAAALASLGMTMARPGLLRGAWHVAKVELTELRSSPGLYLFIPLMLLLTLTVALVDIGFLDTSLHRHADQLRGAHDGHADDVHSACFCCSTRSSRSSESGRPRLAAIAFATPIRSGSLLLGKSVALAVVALVDRAGDAGGRGRSRS